jgi:hypothetical protein
MVCVPSVCSQIEDVTVKRMTLLIVLVSALTGCMQVDENPSWNPQADLPSWCYDAPYYYVPTEELMAQESIGTGIPVYYTNQEYFFIRHPAGGQVTGAPRVGVWSSISGGRVWNKSGYYGAEQSFFLFRAEMDGAHWIRFVGPGQAAAQAPPGQPQRIYIVDRQPPKIALSVTPPQWDDEERTIPHLYTAGEEVTLHWAVRDSNLAADTVRLGWAFNKFPLNVVWNRYDKPLPDSGSLKIVVPDEAVADGGIRFRIEAMDKADNVGMGVTEVLRVRDRIPTSQPSGVPPRPTTRPTTRPARRMIRYTTTRPDHPYDPTQRAKATGWPEAGMFIRGGTSRYLRWLPPSAENYTGLKLQFTANNGRSWRTITGDLKIGRAAKWTVPAVSSKLCRIRIVGLGADGVETMLVMSREFTVDTRAPAKIDGPTPIPPKGAH